MTQAAAYNFGMIGEPLANPCQSHGGKDHVGMSDQDDVLRAEVQGVSDLPASAALGAGEDQGAGLFRNGRSAIRGAAIGDGDALGRCRLLLERLQQQG